jgi:hypothetical protein
MLEKGLKKGISHYKQGKGAKIIREFNAKLYIFNCVEPMHPIYPTVELSIIIQNFEL